MFLAVEPFSGFSELLQILLLILAAFLIASFLVTVVMHYRRKKEIGLADEDVLQIVAASPENTTYKLEDEYVVFDHSGLIKDYKARLIHNHARYSALKQDYENLETKYKSLLSRNPQIISNNQTNNSMEQPISLNEESLFSDSTNNAYELLLKEKQELVEKLSYLDKSEKEQLTAIQKWMEENQSLKSRLLELEHYKELSEEKRSQVEFLEQQLEQRIKNYHQAENRSIEMNELAERLRIERDASGSALASIKKDLFDKDLQIQSGRDQMFYLENVLNEIKEQNELLQASVSVEQQKSEALAKLLEDERTRVAFIERKLSDQKQMMKRIYTEFTNCIEEAEVVNSPVVSLRAAYVEDSEVVHWEERAIH